MLKLLYASVWFGLLLIPIMGRTAIDGVYQGNLNNNDIVVELITDAKSGQISGRYAQLRYGADITLLGRSRSKDQWELHEKILLPEKMPNQKTGTWILRESGDQLRGIWQYRDSARYQKITLERIGDASNTTAPPQTLAELKANVYLWHKVQQSFLNGDEVTLNKVSYRQVIEPRSKISYPRFTRLPDSSALAVINAQLEEMHYLDIARYFVCQSDPRNTRGDHEQTFGVNYFSEKLFSVAIYEENSCDQKYHQQGDLRTVTFNLLEGKPFDFAMYLKPELRQKYPADELKTIARDVYVTSLIKAGKIKNTQEADQNTCVKYFNDDKQAYQLSFADKGLKFYLLLPADQGCNSEVVLPYAQLNEHVQKDGAFYIKPE